MGVPRAVEGVASALHADHGPDVEGHAAELLTLVDLATRQEAS